MGFQLRLQPRRVRSFYTNDYRQISKKSWSNEPTETLNVIMSRGMEFPLLHVATFSLVLFVLLLSFFFHEVIYFVLQSLAIYGAS